MASPDGPGAAIRSASATASTQLAITLAAARRVLASLAGDPSALDAGPAAVEEGGGGPSAMDADDGRPPPPPAPTTTTLRAALDAAAADYRSASAALKGALADLAAAQEAAGAAPPPDPAAVAAREAAATELEAEVAPLRARADAGNAGALDVAGRLAAMVEDLDAWRVDGIGRWTGA
jgi:hypothetical protein